MRGIYVYFFYPVFFSAWNGLSPLIQFWSLADKFVRNKSDFVAKMAFNARIKGFYSWHVNWQTEEGIK